MRAGALSWILVAGCGPVVAVEGTEGESRTSGATIDPGGSPGAVATGGSLGSVGGVDVASAGVDDGPSDSSSGGSGGGTLPEPPTLPPECPGERLTGDILNPQEVYLAGTLSEGACYRDALAHWSTANDAVAGFDCYFDGSGAMIRPTDGRLLYTNVFEDALREFHCDACPIAEDDEYPGDPLANDTILPADPCSSISLTFHVAPDGSYLSGCTGSWYDAAGTPVDILSEGELLHLGHDNLALTELDVVDLSAGTTTPWTERFSEDPFAIRADPRGGFLLVRSLDSPALLHVSGAGAVTELGTYPAPPNGYAPTTEAALDGCGALIQFARGPETFEDAIIRRDLDGASDLVYSEIYDPRVAIHISALVTGP